MVVINVAKDFAKITGFRTYADGPFSGQEFFDVLLKSKFEEAINSGVKLKVILDGDEGHTSSFINESFRLLGAYYGADTVWDNLIVVSSEVPSYINKVKQAVYEKTKK